jgi:hypothetical protein
MNHQKIWNQANQTWNSLSPQNQKYAAIALVVLVLSTFGSVFSPSRAPAPARQASTPALSETALGLIGDQGITLWQRSDGCLIAKGVDDRKLRLLGTDHERFKQSLKDRYNASCLYFE